MYGPALLVPVPVSASITKTLINRWATKRRQEYWTNIKDHRQSKMAVPAVSLEVCDSIKNLTRKQIRVHTHTLTGHNVLRYHLFNMKIEVSPICGS